MLSCVETLDVAPAALAAADIDHQMNHESRSAAARKVGRL